MPEREALSWPSDHYSNNDRQQKVFTVFGISARMGMDATVLGLEILGKFAVTVKIYRVKTVG